MTLRIFSCLGQGRTLACDMVANTLCCAILQTILCIRWRHFPTYTQDVCGSCTHCEHTYKQQQHENNACAIFGICHSHITFYLV